MLLWNLTGLALAVMTGPAPAAAARPSRPAVADSAMLTVDVLTHVTKFWTAFLKEPDSIKMAGRNANQQLVTVSVLSVPAHLMEVDMVAMAAKYPAVAADLKQAGLTAGQWEAYRAAFFGAWIALSANIASQVPASSLLGQNLAFLKAHQEEFNALQATGMWVVRASQGGDDTDGSDLNP